MIKRNTWILLALFAALAGFALYQKYNSQTDEAPDESATPSATIAPVEFLFPADEGVVTSIFIESAKGEIIAAERRENGWVVTRPVEAEADPSPLEAAASQATTLTILDRLDIDPAAAGLRSPAYSITIGFSSGNFITAQVGDETPIESGYYARKEGGSVVVITKEGLDALLGILWYSPALPTSTPPPSETPTQTPTPSAAETPEATATSAP